jgi:hypothetical protein
MPNVSAGIRAYFLTVWQHRGDHIRGEVGNDRILVRALRILLPRYAGPGMTLFRGDSTFNRRRKTYGLAWSADEDVADGFAQSLWLHMKGGSVVLRAEVPAAAIIAAIDKATDHCGEREFFIDRRFLKKVEVLRWYGQMPV